MPHHVAALKLDVDVDLVFVEFMLNDGFADVITRNNQVCISLRNQVSLSWVRR